MTVTAPPRPPRPSDPVDREELEALVEALIEEARQRGRRRRRIYTAAGSLVALLGIAVFTAFDRAAQSQTTSSALAARPAVPASTPRAKIAFTSTPIDPDRRVARRADELYVVNADGTEKRLVARILTDASTRPGWSPDGQTIAFAGWRGGKDMVLFVQADGSGQRDVTRDWGLDGFPVWSYEGQRIAFAPDRLDRSDIYVINADGSGRRNLTRSASSEKAPVWSPDGTKIAFARFRPPTRTARSPSFLETDVYFMNADGSGQRRLAAGWPASWSPDGRKIAFTRGHYRMSEIYVMNASGTGQRRLTHNAVIDQAPAWSPDGRKIAFNRGHGDSWDIYVMNADGSGQRMLSRRGMHPQWSPDGTLISFATGRDGNFELYVMNADGTEQRNLSQNPLADDFGHAWSPPQKG